MAMWLRGRDSEAEDEDETRCRLERSACAGARLGVLLYFVPPSSPVSFSSLSSFSPQLI